MHTHTIAIMKCNKCNSEYGYVRISTQQWVCRKCGNIQKLLTAKQMAKNFMGLEK